MSPAKHSFGKCDRKSVTDGRTTDKVIPMCRYASQATQKPKSISDLSAYTQILPYYNRVDSDRSGSSWLQDFVETLSSNHLHSIKVQRLQRAEIRRVVIKGNNSLPYCIAVSLGGSKNGFRLEFGIHSGKLSRVGQPNPASTSSLRNGNRIMNVLIFYSFVVV